MTNYLISAFGALEAVTTDSCKIHDKRPRVCRQGVISSDNISSEGSAAWGVAFQFRQRVPNCFGFPKLLRFSEPFEPFELRLPPARPRMLALCQRRLWPEAVLVFWPEAVMLVLLLGPPQSRTSVLSMAVAHRRCNPT